MYTDYIQVTVALLEILQQQAGTLSDPKLAAPMVLEVIHRISNTYITFQKWGGSCLPASMVAMPVYVASTGMSKFTILKIELET